METLQHIAETLSLLLAVFFAYAVVEAWYYQLRLGQALQRDLGFQEGTASIRVGRGRHSAVAITGVDEDGIFAKAGFVAGDVLPELSHTGLFKRLHRHRGRTVELTVVDGGQGPSFVDRPKRILSVRIPPT